MTPLWAPSPGAEAVLEWSRRIHGVDSDRHTWAIECAARMDQNGPEAELPAFPSRLHGTRASRDETVRRLYRQATG